MEIRKDVLKDIESYKPIDFVKVFLRLYKDEYDLSYPVNFIRDCSLMSKAANKLYMCGQNNEEVLSFIRWAWKRRESYKKDKYNAMRISLLYSIVDDYIKLKGFKKLEVKREKTETQLDKEMKAWLERERNK